MPHLILKHSNTIKESTIDYDLLFQHLSASLASNNFCDLNAIKCYLITPNHTYLPTKDFFIHMDLLLLERENIQLVHEKAKVLRTFIKTAFPKSYEIDPNAFSFEIRFMNKHNYFKGALF